MTHARAGCLSENYRSHYILKAWVIIARARENSPVARTIKCAFGRYFWICEYAPYSRDWRYEYDLERSDLDSGLAVAANLSRNYSLLPFAVWDLSRDIWPEYSPSSGDLALYQKAHLREFQGVELNYRHWQKSLVIGFENLYLEHNELITTHGLLLKSNFKMNTFVCVNYFWNN